jgi:uncharacterized membrane protein
MQVSTTGLSLAVATSAVNVVMDVSRKKALYRRDLITTTFWMRLFAFLLISCGFVYRLCVEGVPAIHDCGPIFGLFGASWPPLTKFLLCMAVDSCLIAALQFFYLSALQSSDLSLCSPFLAFTPVLLIPVGYLLLRELPTQGQMLGVILVLCGSLLMNRSAFRVSLLEPLKEIFRQRGSRYMLICAFIFAVTNPLDKVIVQMSNPATYALCYGLMLVLIYGILSLSCRNAGGLPKGRASTWVVCAGVLDGAVLLLQFAAYRYLDVFVTVTIKRAGVILSVLAGWLIFREKNIANRLVVACVMLVGVVLITTSMNLAVQYGIALLLLVLLAVWLRMTRFRGDEADA